jgi:hypothetical protein
MEKRGRRAQFYLIGAIIIIALIITLATVGNKVYVKKEPKKFYDLADILNTEGKIVIDNALYNKSSISKNIEGYLTLFSKYLEENTNEDFNLIILYGNINQANNLTGKIYSRASIGEININIGSSSFQLEGGDTVLTNTTTIMINHQTAQTINITITSNANPDLRITEELPILSDSNFIFVMTTSSGFNQYVQNNINPEARV